MAVKQVLSLGQCDADHYGLARLLHESFGVEAVAVDTPREALDELRRQGYALVLVNRLLDRGGSGLEFIARMKGDDGLRAVPVMLVSDLAGAQQEAEALGALPGFGKCALGSPTTVQRLTAALGDHP